MAGYGGQLVALDVNNTPIDVASPLMDAAKLQAMNVEAKKSTLDLQNQLMQRSALMDYVKSQSQSTTPAAQSTPSPLTAPPPTPSALIATAASSADTPEKWDALMTAAVQNGAPEAKQFIGRFTPKLKEQVSASYSQPASPLAAAPSPTSPSPLGANQPPQNSPPAGTPGPQGVSPLAKLAIFNPALASAIANTQARLKYAQSGDIGDLRIDPEAMAHVAKATQDMSEAQKTQYGLAADGTGRAAQAALTIPAGPQRDAYFQSAIDNLIKNGVLPKDGPVPHAGGPITDDVLQRYIIGAQNITDYMRTSGQEAGNEARAKQPYELQQIGARAAAEGAQARATQAADVPNKIAVERSKFITAGPDATVIDPMAIGTPPVGATSGAATPGTQPNTPAPLNKFSAEVPTYQLPGGAQPTPGVLRQGKTPSQTTAENAAVKQYEETASVANAAADVKGQLGTMKAQLDQGLNTNALAPQKAIISAYINALAGPEQAKAITGIDPAQADVFNKDATRLGFALSRTLGAREAMQTIQAAIKANPNMMNTLEGNRTVISLLDKSADRQIDAQKFADAYYQKNGHYVGAESAFNDAHPAAEYVSKAVPYSLPRKADGGLNAADLQPNVTYTTPKGKVVWDAAQKHFVPAQ